MGRSPRSVAVAALAIAASLLVACGSSDEEAESASSTSAAASGAPDARSGQGAAWEEVVRNANEEGALTWYHTHPNNVADEMIAAFNKEYPDIEVSYIRGPTAEVQQRYTEELNAGRPTADVLENAEPTWTAEQDTTPLVGPFTESWDPQFWETDNNLAWTSAQPMGIVYNTDAVDFTPESKEDFLRPDFKGFVGMPDVTGGVQMFYYDTMGKDFLEKLAPLGPAIRDSAATLAQAVAAGEFAFSALGTPGQVAPLRDQGAPVDIFFESAGPTGAFRSIVPKSSPHPNAAQVFIDFEMSEAGQTILNGNGRGISYNDELHDKIGTGIQGVEWEDLVVMEGKYYDQTWQAEFRSYFDSLFKANR